MVGGGETSIGDTVELGPVGSVAVDVDSQDDVGLEVGGAAVAEVDTEAEVIAVGVVEVVEVEVVAVVRVVEIEVAVVEVGVVRVETGFDLEVANVEVRRVVDLDGDVVATSSATLSWPVDWVVTESEQAAAVKAMAKTQASAGLRNPVGGYLAMFEMNTTQHRPNLKVVEFRYTLSLGVTWLLGKLDLAVT